MESDDGDGDKERQTERFHQMFLSNYGWQTQIALPSPFHCLGVREGLRICLFQMGFSVMERLGGFTIATQFRHFFPLPCRHIDVVGGAAQSFFPVDHVCTSDEL